MSSLAANPAQINRAQWKQAEQMEKKKKHELQTTRTSSNQSDFVSRSPVCQTSLTLSGILEPWEPLNRSARGPATFM